MDIAYKISYGKRFSEEGTCYRQMISAEMSNTDLSYFNALVRKGKAESGNERFKLYAQELQEGDNFTHLTTAEYFAYMTNIINDKRFKGYKNTLIRIKLV